MSSSATAAADSCPAGSGLDCTNASRGVWLVKVPKYMDNRWQKAQPMSELGRLKINKGSNGKPEILFNLSVELTKTTDTKSTDALELAAIPIEHQFSISDIQRQTLAVFSQSNDDSSVGLALEGHVVQKGEYRPISNDRYMNLKMCAIKQASQPTRTVKQLEKAVTNFKPISQHKTDVEFELKKKAEGKKSREDKDKVMDVLFRAFEKHQYYNIKDLEKITRQPVPYLKEILKEMCVYNPKNPHKNMWELKPEYRHYNQSQQSKS
ncbi:general transcription factor IIF subunit 2-like [Oppia nitens]|uniref:general transcription factor IIF subunit 2-like n=1 Tax=Oppia nitens TaxID=1686743 RepID=UPI0023DAB7FB|nr:general transcription factor IIF subunit 2-like [Oppia nitens]